MNKSPIIDVIFHREFTRHGPYKSQHVKGATVTLRWRDILGRDTVRNMEVTTERGHQFRRELKG